MTQIRALPSLLLDLPRDIPLGVHWEMVSADWLLFYACNSLLFSNVCTRRSLFLFRVSFHAAYCALLLHTMLGVFSVEPDEVTGGLPSH